MTQPHQPEPEPKKPKRPYKPSIDQDVWRPKFLEAFEKTGNISYSAKYANVDRMTASAHMKRDAAFGKKCAQAKVSAIEAMEFEAWRRGTRGVPQPVFQGGKKVGEVTEFSDTLLIFMLKALNPEKYRERYESKVSMEVSEIKVKLDGVYGD